MTTAGRQPSEADKATYRGVNHSPYRPVLLRPGTVVAAGRLRGVVQPYVLEWSHGGFPVRFDHTGQTRIMGSSTVTVVAAPEGTR